MKNIFLFLAFSLCLQLSLAYPSDDAADTIPKALEFSGIKSQLAGMQPGFQEVDLYAYVSDYFRKHNEEENLAVVLKWFDSPFSRKIIKLELEVQTPEGIKKAGDYFEKMGSIMDIKARIDLIKELERTMKNSDFQIELARASLNAYLESINELLPSEERIKAEESAKITAEKIDKQKGVFQANILKLMIYAYNPLTDEELGEYVAFMKSAPAQWFNDCYNRSLILAVTESVKKYIARMVFVSDGLKQIKKEFVLPENPEWFTIYYYRNKDKERLTFSLKEMLLNRDFLLDKEHADYIVHFFSTTIKDDAKIKEELRAMKDKYTGAEKEIIGNILNEAEAYVPAQPESRQAINLMWAEFRATGDKEIISKIVGVFALSEGSNNDPLVKAAQQSLFVNSIKDRKVRDILKEMGSSLNDDQKTKIAGILSMAEGFEDLSWNLMQSAYSHLTLKKDEEGALKEDESALLYCTDYANVYNNISNIYEHRGDKNKTLIYRQASIYIDPDYETGYFNLGRHYFLGRDYDNAIKFYSKALEYNPKSINYNHGLARSYQERGDTANAVKYFKIYLEYGPNDEFSGLVRSYLASVGVPVKEDTSDPFVMLKNKRYETLEKYLSNLLQKKQKDNNGKSLISNAYLAVCEPKGTEFISDQLLQLFEGWLKSRPQSHFANACLGTFYVRYAWQVRGTGYADAVTEESHRLFKERLSKAENYLEKAYQLDDSDPIVPVELINVSLGLGRDRQYMEKQFQRGIKADPTEYRLYRCKLIYLMPKWYGSREEMFSFARESTKSAPANTLIPKIVVEARWEVYWQSDDNAYFRQPEVWEEVRNTYLRLLESFPDSFELRNWFALAAYHAGDYKIVKEQINLIGDKWDQGDAWKNLQEFEKVKKEVNS